MPRDTFANINALTYRLRAAGALLGVTDNTLRSYADNAGVEVKRASEITPGAPAVRVFTPSTLFELAQWRRSQGYVKTPNESADPVVIAVEVIKGGTGKTTTSVELALHLQLMGLRCLLIDLDVQANATQMMGYEPDLQLDELDAYDLSRKAIVEHTFVDVAQPYLERGRASRIPQGALVDPIKRPFGECGPALIPSDMYLGDLEQLLVTSKGMRETHVRRLFEDACAEAVENFRPRQFDVVIFDCPPSSSFLTSSALVAADLIIAPIRLDAFSVKGFIKLVGEVEGIANDLKLYPELAILPTHYAPQLTRIGRMQTQLQKYKDLLLDCAISASEEFPRSLEEYLPLSLQKPTSNGAKEYRVLAETVLPRILEISKKKIRSQS
jgi:cellulose biosynthesis protein BcsQ